ncbi:DNA-binding protein [Ruminococcus sp. AM42-11]|nr:helix-turn-helix domain-containing protein [Ruminococcus sp. AM42-11]RHS99871.1 DNA-binding protein [Ruminococcus sp. AM42-11]
MGKNRIYELLNTGKLKGFRMGSTWKISRMALENYILNASEL